MNIANDNIILVGFMASGKTTVGTYLSSITNRTFVDTDQLLVEQFGTSIAEFFKRELACELLPTTTLGGGPVVIGVVYGAVLCAASGSQQMEV